MLTWHVLELWSIWVISALIRLFHMPLQSITLYTLTSVCIFSTLLLYISQAANKENMFHNQKRLKLMMISCILVTLMFESGVIF